jgi:hypothetical protein
MGTDHGAGSGGAGTRAAASTPLRVALAVALAGLLLAGCSGSGDEGARPTTHAQAVTTLTGLLPADARGAFAFDLASLRSGGSSAKVTALLHGQGGHPLFERELAAVGTLTRSIGEDEVSSALLAQTTDGADGLFLVAQVGHDAIGDVVAGSVPRSAGTYGRSGTTLYAAGNGNRLALLPGGVLVVGRKAVVESVVDVADGAQPRGRSAIVPFLAALDGKAQVSFVYGLPALFDRDVKPDRTLRGAAVVSGSFRVVGGRLRGSLAFHTTNAAEFVKAYNTLNRHATAGEHPSEEPLTVGAPVARNLRRVVVPLPDSPIDASTSQTLAVRNVAKKLFVGMEAHDYAEDVASTANPAWIDLIIKSEADRDVPPSPARSSSAGSSGIGRPWRRSWPTSCRPGSSWPPPGSWRPTTRTASTSSPSCSTTPAAGPSSTGPEPSGTCS